MRSRTGTARGLYLQKEPYTYHSSGPKEINLAFSDPSSCTLTSLSPNFAGGSDRIESVLSFGAYLRVSHTHRRQVEHRPRVSVSPPVPENHSYLPDLTVIGESKHFRQCLRNARHSVHEILEVVVPLAWSSRAFVFALSSCSNTHLLSPATSSLYTFACQKLNHAARFAAVLDAF